MLKIKVPATLANLGPGFDTLGIALQEYNYFYFNMSDSGFKIEIKDRDTGAPLQLPLVKNLVYQGMKRVFSICDQQIKGIELIEEVGIPFARGMGSSASAILAGLTGANSLLGNPLTEDALLKLAVEIEGHPDNIVPAFKGGFVINVMAGDELIYKRREVSQGIKIVLVIPEFQLETGELRKVLPEKVDHKDAVFNHSRTALLTAILYDNDWDKLSIAMEDRLHQDYRAELIPGFKKVVMRAYNMGALGVALSGAGPTVLAFARNNERKIGRKMVDTFAEEGINSRYLVTGVDNKGICMGE